MQPNNENGPQARAESTNQTGQAHPSNSAEQSQESFWVPVSKTTKCNRCGRSGLAWQQARNRKWYLVVTRRTRDGKIEADRRGFHKCQPTFTNAHGTEVSDADIPF